MSIPVIIFLSSILIILALLLRRLPEASGKSSEEIAFVVATRNGFSGAFLDGGSGRVADIWQAYVRRPALDFLVTLVSKLRLSTLKFEQYLLRLTAIIRERSHGVSKTSQYWQDVQQGWRRTVGWGTKKIKIKPYTPEVERQEEEWAIGINKKKEE